MARPLHLPFFLLFASFLLSQSMADSLLRVLPTFKEDSTKVLAYLDLVNEYYRIDLNKALDYATKVEELSQKLGLVRKLAKAKRNVSYMLTNLNHYDQANEKYNAALLVFTEVGDRGELWM